MNHCPHCGASLGENARFCPHCMTALNAKRVIPTPKYPPVRWLSATAAVLVLCAAVGGGWMAARQTRPENSLPAAVPNTTVTTAETTVTTATTTAPTTTLTTLVTQSTTAASVTKSDTQGTWSTTSSATYTEPVTEDIPPTSTSTATQTATTGRTNPTSTTGTSATTSTQKPTTTTTKPVPTYPAEWNTVYRSTTEDDLPIEEVNWTYKAAGEELCLSRYSLGSGPSGFISRTYTETMCYDIPMSQCIILTGFDAPTENGIYRIPAAIDGKVVVGVDMRENVEGVCHFNDEDVAPTVKRLYLPPELLMIQLDTINQCTSLERIYFGCHTIWIEPKALPLPLSTMYLYSETLCYLSCSAPPYDLPVLQQYCVMSDTGSGIVTGLGYYKQTSWRLSNFAWNELYD